MKILVEINHETIERMASDMYPELVRHIRCCSGFECGCGGMPEEDSEEAVVRLEKDLTEDMSYFIETMSEEEGNYTIKEIYG